MMASLFAASRFVGSQHSLQRFENVQIVAKVPFSRAFLPLGAQLAGASAPAFFSILHDAYSVN